MAAPLPHDAAALQRTLVMAVVSVALHALVVVAIALAPSRTPPRLTTAAPVIPIELDGSELSASDSGLEGREDRAQGTPTRERAVEASPPSEPAEAPRDDSKPPSPPHTAPSPPAPRPPPPAPAEPAAPATPADAPPAAAPSETATPRTRPPTPTASVQVPAARPASSGRATGSPEPDPATSGSARAPTSASSTEPGDGGGPVRRAARDLAASFARELPPSSDSMSAWRTLPLGEVGMVTVELRTGADGRLEGESVFAERSPTEALVEVVRRTRSRLGRSILSAAGKTAGPGSVKLRLRARIDAIEIGDDLPGGSFNLSFAFRDERGECAFSLPEGRRVTVSIEVVSRTPG